MARSGDVVYDVFYEPNFTYQSNGIFTISDTDVCSKFYLCR